MQVTLDKLFFEGQGFNGEIGASQVVVRVFDHKLPVWETDGGIHAKSRLDNNYFAPAYYSVSAQLQGLIQSGGFTLMKLDDMLPVEQQGGLTSGKSPSKQKSDEVVVPIVEGSNLRPNYIRPLFPKYAHPNPKKRVDLAVGDLLLGKDGEPGVFSVVTSDLMQYCQDILGTSALAASTHVYRIRFSDDYAGLAYYICMFLNSKVGQAIVRRYVAGGTTPTLRSTDVLEFVVPVPQTPRAKLAKDARVKIEELQRDIISSALAVSASGDLLQALTLKDPEERLPINFVGGGRSDPHGYYRDYEG